MWFEAGRSEMSRGAHRSDEPASARDLRSTFDYATKKIGNFF
jgi:hypothetical protein